MKRNHLAPPNPIIPQELINRTAFHEAGHAVSIYLYNRLKQLPPVYFSIKFKKPDITAVKETVARIDGGRLIQSLPTTGRGFCGKLTMSHDHVQNSYFTAFEADIVNLMSGPLAEAKYVAQSDGEEFDDRLLNYSALSNYGGASDIKIINSYLNSCFDCRVEKNAKIAELFKLAFEFVNESAVWGAVTALAHHIRDSDNQLIECEEAIEVINNAVRMRSRY